MENDTPTIAERPRLENVAGPAYTLDNEVSDWVQIAPFGDFPHARGIQRMDRAAAATMVQNLELDRQRKAERFVGIPFFAGHPDVPQRAGEFTDRRAHGWLKHLEPREDGLWGRVEWAETGKDLLQNKHYKFLSPFWGVEPIGQMNGRPIFRPSELVSVGLTNEPNIPVRPLANSQERVPAAAARFDRARLLELLHLDEYATEADIKKHIKQLGERADEADTIENTTEAIAADRIRLESEREQLEEEIVALENAIKAERTARAEFILDNAIQDGRLAPWQKPSWMVCLANDFEAGRRELENLRPTMKLASVTRDVRGRRLHLANESSRAGLIQSKVQAKLLEGKDYDTAFSEVYAEFPILFAGMQEPKLRL